MTRRALLDGEPFFVYPAWMRFITLSEDDKDILNKAAIWCENWGGLLGNPLPWKVREIRDRANEAPDALVTITGWLNDHWTGLDDWDTVHIEDVACDLMDRLAPRA